MIREIRPEGERGLPTEEARLKVTFEELSPEEAARFRARQERFRRNTAWLQAHAAEVYGHRGKYVCVAGQQAFVADTAEEAVAQARAAHPEDDGYFVHFVPKERAARIYAH
jgi:hypothetical protein